MSWWISIEAASCFRCGCDPTEPIPLPNSNESLWDAMQSVCSKRHCWTVLKEWAYPLQDSTACGYEFVAEVGGLLPFAELWPNDQLTEFSFCDLSLIKWPTFLLRIQHCNIKNGEKGEVLPHCKDFGLHLSDSCQGDFSLSLTLFVCGVMTDWPNFDPVKSVRGGCRMFERICLGVFECSGVVHHLQVLTSGFLFNLFTSSVAHWTLFLEMLVFPYDQVFVLLHYRSPLHRQKRRHREESEALGVCPGRRSWLSAS